MTSTARKFYIASNTVFEQVRGGSRAVSPAYNSNEEAYNTLQYLIANPSVARVKKDDKP